MTPLPHRHRYLVSGIDQDGDVQAFASDDFVAAGSVREQMEDEMQEVKMIDTGDE
jgi:hypothetical protein